uniref:Uncharacterized protein n=1 Tax=uncultured organism BAC21E04 TaxID=382346 RepID=Q5Y1A0_9ZZZZ|nr:hypothetical protein [uncultured organism BAC21E04]
MPSRQLSNKHILMTILQDNTAIVSDLVAGGQQSDISMMIGVGVNKDSDAVFFMYRGDDQEPVALTIPTSGKPLTRIGNVKVTGINIAEDIGTFKSTKLNLFLTTNSGKVYLVTSGLTTLWSQCVLTGLMGAFETGNLEFALTLDTWKGTSKMKPCFAAIRSGDLKMSDTDLYEQLKEARADRDNKKVETILRDCVSIIGHAISPSTDDSITVNEVNIQDNNTEELF